MIRNYIGKEYLDVPSIELKYYILEEVVEVNSQRYVEYGIEIENMNQIINHQLVLNNSENIFAKKYKTIYVVFLRRICALFSWAVPFLFS